MTLIGRQVIPLNAFACFQIESESSTSVKSMETSDTDEASSSIDDDKRWFISTAVHPNSVSSHSNQLFRLYLGESYGNCKINKFLKKDKGIDDSLYTYDIISLLGNRYTQKIEESTPSRRTVKWKKRASWSNSSDINSADTTTRSSRTRKKIPTYHTHDPTRGCSS